MQTFDYRRERTVEAASHAARIAPTHASPSSRVAQGSAAADRPGTPLSQPAQFIAGGTNMTDYMTLGVVRPQLLIDINPIKGELVGIESDATRLRFGALVRMAEAEDHPVVRNDYPVIQQSLMLAASRQIRNMASLGGNLLQRTRCEYYRETSWPCNRRAPGSGCSALDGFNRQHAVLGTSEHCIAAYPGDFAQALIALDAKVEILGSSGSHRQMLLADLHRLPGDTPYIENSLQPGELITAIEVPAGPWTRRSCYLKIRDRQSYQFALTSAAVALHLESGVVREARIALGGVATVPWRAREAESVLVGQRLDETVAVKAAEAAFANARVRKHNAFKVPLGKQTIVRALLEAGALQEGVPS
jgi:xanthine dehydrogenase YagS FAD-binding subunit